ncbi:MAG: aliphatic sulfonate ABC transporter substrate-binding protein [Oscillatoria princeps RMCB-10]|nr:aliphatic sulfonate ABC transporter substrate-binding protein [Oscillatoria princeps RMCB-10]
MKLRTLVCSLAVFLVSLMVAVSCTPSQRPTANTSPATPHSTTPIRLGFSNWPSYLNWQVAQEKEIFADRQVDVDLKFYDYEKSVQVMAQGQLDANVQTLSDSLTSIANGSQPDQVIVLATDASNGGDAIIVRKGINKIADLKGKTVATQLGAIDHFLLLLGLKKAGLKQTDIQLKNLDPRATVAAFVEGQVDAVGLYLPYTKEALKLPGSKVLFSSKDFPTAIPSHLVVDRKLIEERPQDVQALVNTWFDTLELIRNNPEKSYKIMADYIGVSVEEFKAYEREIKFFSPAENLKAFQPGSGMTSLPYAAQEISNFLLANGIIKKQPDLSQLFDDRFIKAYAASLKG